MQDWMRSRADMLTEPIHGRGTLTRWANIVGAMGRSAKRRDFCKEKVNRVVDLVLFLCRTTRCLVTFIAIELAVKQIAAQDTDPYSPR